jgi:4-alpha-glucanotransferase
MIQEGQTATNPKTGQKIVFKGGQWRLLQGAPGAAPAAPMSKLSPQEQTQLGDLRQSAQTFGEIADQAGKFVELNRGAATGPIYKIPFADAVGEFFNPNVAQMNALASRMAPQQRMPGSGTTSDRDLALFLKAIPSTERMGAANEAIATDMRGMADKRRQRAYFFDQFAQQNGTLRGAQEAFDRMWAQRQAAPKPKPVTKPQAGSWKVIGEE